MAKKKRRDRGTPAVRETPRAGALAPEPEKRAEGGPARVGRRRWLAAAAALILIAAAVIVFSRRGGPGREIRREEGLNVLLVTLDTTRADHIGCYSDREARTPTIDSLAEKGVRFANAYCSVPLTLPSHASILTGLEPYHHGVHANGTYVLSPGRVTLAERLRTRGYRTAAFTASFTLDSRFGLDQGFDLYDDDLEPGSSFQSSDAERRGGEVATRFSRWLGTDDGRPFFAWVHFYDPHFPYDPPPDYRKDFAARPYDGEIAYMDSCLGQVIGALKSRGLLERTLVVLAGDHGEGLGEKVEQEHGVFIYEMAVKVPLLFYCEKRLPSGSVMEPAARTIDIVPTVLDILRIAGASVDGRSLVPAIEGRERRGREIYLESFYPRESWGWSELVGLVADGWKYVQAPRPELYDLVSDPGESKDLAGEKPDKVRELKGRLEKLLVSAPAAAGERRELSLSEQEKLRSLGYVQFAAEGGSAYPDPKDRLEDLRLYQRSVACEAAGDYPGMEGALRELLPRYAKVPAMYVDLALAQSFQKKYPEAVETLKTGLGIFPGSDFLQTRLGHTYFVMGSLPEALEAMRQALAANPYDLEALSVSATVLERLGRPDEALTHIDKALTIEPGNAALRKARGRLLGSSGRLEEAIDVFAALTRDFPDDASGYRYLGDTYALKKDYGPAVENLEIAARLRPDPIVFRHLAVCYAKMGQVAEAVQALEKYLADPRDEPAAAVRQGRAELERLKALSR